MSWPPVVVHVEGEARLRRTLAAAARDLSDLGGANREAGVIAAAGVRQGAPRRSGFLASTVRPGTDVDAAVVAVTAAYAGVIDRGWAARNIQPTHFATEGVERTEPAWLDSYRDAIEDALRKVKGA